MLHQYQEAQIFFSALRLNIFSYLSTPVTSAHVAKSINCNEKMIEVYLLALSESGFIHRDKNCYYNTEEAELYLTKQSAYYLGETILFRETMTSLANIEDKLKGDVSSLQQHDYDFSMLARVVIPEMYATGRVSEFLKEVELLFQNKNHILKALDLGGGSGILSIEFTRSYPASKAIVFEHPSVSPTTEEIILKHKAESRVSVLSGDFNVDDIGNEYDLIIASGILDFATSNINDFMLKISNALKERGYLILIGRFSNGEGYPSENILSWLSGYLSGMTPPPSKKEVENALGRANMHFIRLINSGRFQGLIYQKQ